MKFLVNALHFGWLWQSYLLPHRNEVQGRWCRRQRLMVLPGRRLGVPRCQVVFDSEPCVRGSERGASGGDWCVPASSSGYWCAPARGVRGWGAGDWSPPWDGDWGRWPGERVPGGAERHEVRPRNVQNVACGREPASAWASGACGLVPRPAFLCSFHCRHVGFPCHFTRPGEEVCND